MKVNIKYFGAIAEKTGRYDELIDVSEPIDSSSISEVLKAKYGLHDLTYRLSVNRKLVDERIEIKENDEIALLPPFAGG